MLKKFFSVLVVLFITTNLVASNKSKLPFYCGITMVKPMKEIAKIIEKKDNCIIKITQGVRKTYTNL